jgi:hypothetical protein
MRSTTIRPIAGERRCKGAFPFCITLLLVCCGLALIGNPITALAQAAPQATPAAQAAPEAKQMPPMPSAPSAGKALVCIYRQGRAVGSAAHDHLYVNNVYVGTLLNGEYTWAEVAPGTVVVAGMAKMYYGPSVIMSSAAAINQTRKEDERLRLEAEAGKTYYMKWTSGMFASGIKVEMMDPGVGAKEMSKLHPTKIGGEKGEEKNGDKDAGKK